MSDLMPLILFRKGDDINNLAALIDSFPSLSEIPYTFIYKGFSGSNEVKEHLKRLGSMVQLKSHDAISVPDVGFDCNSYWTASKYFKAVLCINSHARVLNGNFYQECSEHIFNKNVGLVGFFSSNQSIYSLLLEQRKYFKAVLARVLFKKYPNFHIRTNCFAMRTETMMSMIPPLHKTKFEAHVFESGRNSLTNLVKRKGLYVYQPKGQYFKDNRSDYVF